MTEIGWKLGRLPVDPRVGRILLAADENGTLPEMLPIAAALEVQDPRDRPPDKRQAADEAHARFADPRSDFLVLSATVAVLRTGPRRSRSKQADSRSSQTVSCHRPECASGRMSTVNCTRWPPHRSTSREEQTKSRRRIGKIRYCDDAEKLVDDDRYVAIHQSLLAGLLSGVAMIGDKNEYTGAGGLKLFLWPGSGVSSSKPKWIVAAELVETSKQFARTVARIQPQWIEQIAAHVLKRSHQDPHWSGKSGGAFCYENLFLFGLPIVTRRRVPAAADRSRDGARLVD